MTALALAAVMLNGLLANGSFPVASILSNLLAMRLSVLAKVRALLV